MYDHIVLVSIDTLRSDAIAANPWKLWPAKYPGLDRPRTHLLDELVERGCYFANAVSAAPYTSSSHGTFLTGRWPLRHGVWEFFNRPLCADTLFRFARERGWTTRLKVDFPVILGPHLGFDRDVDEYIIEDDDAFLDRLHGDRPSFNLVHFGGCHIPYGFHNLRYGGEAYRTTVEQLERGISLPPEQLADRLVESYRDAADLDLLRRYKRIVQFHYQRGEYDQLFALYLAGVQHHLEQRIEPFWRRMEAQLAGKRVLYVVFGDHGEEYDADSYGHFSTMAEGVLRVPVLFVDSEQVRPALHDRRIRTVDVAPTILSLAGWDADIAPDLDGASLAEVVRGEALPAPRQAIAQAYIADTVRFVAHQQALLAGQHTGDLPHIRFSDAMYDDAFKLERRHYAWELGGSFAAMPTLRRLFWQRPDTSFRELRNTDVANRLTAALDAYEAERVAHEAIVIAPEVRASLADMGYRV